MVVTPNKKMFSLENLKEKLFNEFGILKLIFLILTIYLITREFEVFLIRKPTYSTISKTLLGKTFRKNEMSVKQKNSYVSIISIILKVLLFL